MITALLIILFINLVFVLYIYYKVIRIKNKRIKRLEEYEYRFHNKYVDDDENRSDCCGSLLIGDTDLCSCCKEHTGK